MQDWNPLSALESNGVAQNKKNFHFIGDSAAKWPLNEGLV